MIKTKQTGVQYVYAPASILDQNREINKPWDYHSNKHHQKVTKEQERL